MPDNTANYALVKPTVGANRDTWGSFLNSDLDAIDAIMAALCPIGTVVDYAGNAAPPGWLMCDGTLLPVSSYPKLFAAIGNLYGGDGISSFGVPDCRGRVTAGAGVTTDSGGTVDGYALARKYGYYVNPILQAHLPSSVAVTIDAVGDHAHGGYTDAQGLHSHSGGTDAQGSHSHSVSASGVTDTQGDHNHTYSYSNLTTSGGIAVGNPYNVPGTTGTTSTNGAHAHNVSVSVSLGAVGNHSHTIGTTTDGNHQHLVQTYAAGAHTHAGRIAGGNVPLDVRNPMIAFNKIIFTGPPGFATLSSPIPGAPARLTSPMRGGG